MDGDKAGRIERLINERFNMLDRRFNDLEERMTKMEKSFKSLGAEIRSDVDLKLKDGFARHSEIVRFLKDTVTDKLSMNRLERPFTHETVIPRSISSYSVKEVSDLPWDPEQAKQ